MFRNHFDCLLHETKKEKDYCSLWGPVEKYNVLLDSVAKSKKKKTPYRVKGCSTCSACHTLFLIDKFGNFVSCVFLSGFCCVLSVVFWRVPDDG